MLQVTTIRNLFLTVENNFADFVTHRKMLITSKQSESTLASFGVVKTTFFYLVSIENYSKNGN